MTLQGLNAAPEEEASKALLACCGSHRWAAEMLGRRPFENADTLHKQAQATWRALSPSDWLEAFAQHPKIGEQSNSKWSRQEQGKAANGTADVLEKIRILNVQYQRQFGYIFIVCATGKSAEEIHSALEERLRHEPPAELQTAAAEQAKIMRLRLDKLLSE